MRTWRGALKARVGGKWQGMQSSWIAHSPLPLLLVLVSWPCEDSSLLLGGDSHKTSVSNPLLRFYYKKPALFSICVFNEACLLALYLLHFTYVCVPRGPVFRWSTLQLLMLRRCATFMRLFHGIIDFPCPHQRRPVGVWVPYHSGWLLLVPSLHVLEATDQRGAAARVIQQVGCGREEPIRAPVVRDVCGMSTSPYFSARNRGHSVFRPFRDRAVVSCRVVLV